MNDHRAEPRRRLLVILFGLAAGILVIDQVLKFLAVTFLEGQPPIPVIGSLAGFT
ncbi:signal peptidase II, partial [Burkholderia multivorans]